MKTPARVAWILILVVDVGYILRLVYYGIWRIAWGQLRLAFLF